MKREIIDSTGFSGTFQDVAMANKEETRQQVENAGYMVKKTFDYLRQEGILVHQL